MAVATKNVQPVINLLSALGQRQETVRNLLSQINAGTFWRSPDGGHVILMTEEQRAQLETFARAYLDESEGIIAAARALLPGPEVVS